MAENRGRRRYNKNRRPKPKQTYVPKGDPAVLSKPVEELGLSERTLSALKNGKVNTVSDIMCRREFEMLHIQNIGKKNIREVSESLKKLNVWYRPDEPADGNTADGQAGKPRENARQKPDERQGKTRENARDNRSGGGRNEPKKPVRKKPVKLEERVKNLQKTVYGKDDYVKYLKNGKWGFKDVDGKVLIEPEYDSVFDFHEDLAVAEKDGLFGFIDKENNIVIDFKYETALSFSEGLAVCSVGEKSGYIDKEGTEIAPFEFDIATPMFEGRAVVRKDDRWAIFSGDGKVEFR